MQILYVYGKGEPLKKASTTSRCFPLMRLWGGDYQTFSPWETGKEIWSAVDELAKKHEDIWLIANSIGVFSA